MSADVAFAGSGEEEAVEAEEKRRGVTEFGRGVPTRDTRGRMYTVKLVEGADGELEYATRAKKDGSGFREMVVISQSYEIVSAKSSRRARIEADDLFAWLVDHFVFSEDHKTEYRTRNKNPSLRLLPEIERKPSQKVVLKADGRDIEGVFPVGDWSVIGSDGTVISIPRNQASTAIEALDFTQYGSRVWASYAHRLQEKAPTALQGDEGSSSTTINR